MTAIAHRALPLRSRSLLRTALWLDALSVVVMALCLVLFAGPLTPLLGLETGLLRAVGGVLLPFAALLAFTATRERISRVAVGWIIALNALWVVDSFAILLIDWVEPTALGTAFVIVQALIGGAVAMAEYVGLKREAVQAA